MHHNIHVEFMSDSGQFQEKLANFWVCTINKKLLLTKPLDLHI
jgi:hypothetical protein